MIIIIWADELHRDTARLLSNPHVNQKDIQYYPDQIDLKENPDETIAILDLRADGKFQNNFSPEAFVEMLLKGKLSKKVKTIELIVSDVRLNEGTKPLVTYAKEATTLLKKQGYDITIAIPSSLSHQTTLIVPPKITNDNQWHVYGFTSENIKNIATASFDTLYSFPKKESVWSGFDIRTWINKPTHTFTNH